MILCPGYEYDFAALAAAPTRIVVGFGSDSAAMMPGRAAIAVAERLGTAPVAFPGDHGGFASQPDAFATTLRQVLNS